MNSLGLRRHDTINNLSPTMCTLDVGLSTESSSDGFVVDNTPPVTVTRIALDNRIGSLQSGTQVFYTKLYIRRRSTV